MNKKHVFNTSILLVLGTFLFFGCTKEDDTEPQEEIDSFYKNAITTAKTSDILGTWSFYEAEFEGRKTTVPVDYENCDRPYFTFAPNGIFKEYIINDTGCSISELESKYTVENGVITSSSFTADDEELVIVELTDSSFTVKTQLDFDDDGDLDIFALTARRYEPKDRNTSTDSFTVVQNQPLNDKIQFSWQPYDGQNAFTRYEIYRSVVGCDKANATLVATIAESNQTYYVDEKAPVAEELCYFLRIYTDKGLLGESGFSSIITDFLDVLPVGMLEPIVTENSITLNWEASESAYFSHYEIEVRNHDGGTGYGYQEEVLGTVNDRNKTVFIDVNPPYFKNPVYTVKVYDVFGNVNYDYSATVQSSTMARFQRPEVLDYVTVWSTAIDPEDSNIYFFGSQDLNQLAIQKYNYISKRVEATASNATINVLSSYIHFVKSDNGKEVVLPQSNALQVYDAQNLDYKYKLSVEPAFVIEDFSYLGNNLWAVIDDEEVFTYKRDNGNFQLIDRGTHFSTAGSYQNPQQLLALTDNRILIARSGAGNSILFTYDTEGNLIEKKTVNISLNSNIRARSEFNAEQNHIIDYSTNRIYSAVDFTLKKSFEAPYFSSGTSVDGTWVYGSSNDAEWDVTQGSLHEKRAYALHVDSNNLISIESKGYPHKVFRNGSNQIISISSGLKRQNLTGMVPKPDIFVEVIEP